MTFLYCEPFAVFIVGTERRTWGWRGIVGVCCQLVWGSERVFLMTVCPVIPEQDGLELGLIFREMQQRWERPQTWASGQDWWFKLVLEHRGREGSEAIEFFFYAQADRLISTPCKHCQCLLCTDAVQGVCRCLVTSSSVPFPEDYLVMVTVRWISLSVMLFSATRINIVWRGVGCGHLTVTQRVEVHMQDTGRKEFTGEHIGHVVCALVTSVLCRFQYWEFCAWKKLFGFCTLKKKMFGFSVWLASSVVVVDFFWGGGQGSLCLLCFITEFCVSKYCHH